MHSLCIHLLSSLSLCILVSHCNRSKSCRYCPLLDKTGALKSNSSGKTYQSMININCQSSNLIYVISCTHCGIQYVGQTKNRILQRFQGHFHDITHNNDTTVARHFNQCPPSSPSLTKGFSIHVATFIPAPPHSHGAKIHRDKEERRWMHRLCTITPSGLNLLD